MNESGALIPKGWSLIGWAKELWRRADLCCELQPERAAELRHWSEIHRREACEREGREFHVAGYYAGIDVDAG